MNSLVEPRVHQWTRSEYYKMAEAGLFDGRHVELIEGQVIEMAPMGSLHATGVALTAKSLELAFGRGYFVRWQMPFDAGEITEPEPDVAVIAGNIRDYATTHPSTAVLIVEVAETSLEYDRTNKASVYAKAAISDYWILNLIDHQLEIYRNPVPDEAQRYGFRYADKTTWTVADVVTPLAMQSATIAVADLLP